MFGTVGDTATTVGLTINVSVLATGGADDGEIFLELSSIAVILGLAAFAVGLGLALQLLRIEEIAVNPHSSQIGLNRIISVKRLSKAAHRF